MQPLSFSSESFPSSVTIINIVFSHIYGRSSRQSAFGWSTVRNLSGMSPSFLKTVSMSLHVKRQAPVL